jgi:aspartyl/glutamyl-tRNA(Asn/Gln) amidotransferase C subunit
MPLTEDQVRTIASDARIALSADELAALTTDLNQILENIEVITEYDLRDVLPTYHPIAGKVNVMRDDEVKASMPIDEVFANSVLHQDSQFRVPPILDDLGSGGDR